mmetsp:Transcript_38251/g.82390  ORF Transcript_38251/g.82390 Transcript_38251/m.82390 type:complete len:921 (-) Transcript_38251:426-3188(-)
MPKTISRAPKTPRKIRDIRPKRQLLRNNDNKKENDDDGWYQANNTTSNTNGGGGGEQTTQQVRGVSAVNRFRRPPFLERNSDSTSSEEECDNRRKRMCARMIQLIERIRNAPRREKRKRFVLFVILFMVWRSIYFVDLERYSWANMVGNSNNGSGNKLQLPPHVGMTMTSLDDEFSSLRGEPSSLFGQVAQPQQMGFSSSSMTLDRGSEISGSIGSMGSTGFEQETMGMKSMMNQMDNSNPMMLSPPQQQNSRSMTDTIMLGGNDYPEGQNNQQQQQQHMLNQEPPKDLNPILDYSYGNNLRGSNSLDSNTQSMSRSQYGSQSVQMPEKYQPATDNNNLQSMSRDEYNIYGGGNDVDKTNKVAAFPNNNNVKPMGESSGSNQLSNQFSNQNQQHQQQQPVNDQMIHHNIPKTVHKSTSGLNCAASGGPYSESEYSEIVYWRDDIPTDASFASPYYSPQAQEAISTSFWKAKYLTFEMDDSGWNNMRLGLENVMLLAHSMGRTLVLPPKRQLAHGLLDKSGSKVVSFSDFYDIDSINAKQKGLNIITMDQFLEREATSGQLNSNIDGAVVYPPNNQIIWDNQRLGPLWKYIRNVTKSFNWNPRECVLAFPGTGTDDQHLFSMMADVLIGKDGRPFPHYNEYQGRPVNVDAPPIERFREILAGRRKICMYDRNMHEENPVVHFKADEDAGTRLLTQFYAFLWFEDWRHDLWSKRFVRDNLRYNNEIMCLSARIINALRNHARQRSPGNVNGVYDAVHVRRGDFQQQFPTTEMDAGEILAGLKEYIAPGSTIFICTNERDISFFAPIQEVYDVSFLGDFGQMLSDINPNYFPLVEQMVASRGRVFIGTFYSTFSAYIARLRGYYSVKEMHQGHMKGGLRNTYFLPSKYKKEMQLYQAVHEPIYGRDFPVAWRDIDRLELPNVS